MKLIFTVSSKIYRSLHITRDQCLLRLVQAELSLLRVVCCVQPLLRSPGLALLVSSLTDARL